MPLRTHERPNLPYEAQPKRNNQRYQLLSARDQPPTAEMLDSDVDYVVDSLDVLSQDIQNVQAGAIVGSNNPVNANKLVTTDGISVSWTFIRSSNIEDTAVTRTKLGTGAVSTNKIEDGAITNPKMAELSVSQRNMRDNSVGKNQILNRNVTREKLAALAVGANELDNSAVTTPKLGNRSVTQDKIEYTAVGTLQLENKSVTYNKLADEVLRAALFPIGVVLPYAAPISDPFTAPPGWLFCNGRAVLRASYPDLYDLLRDTYGTAEELYFNLPDLRGRAIFGYVGGSTGDRITQKSTKRSRNGVYVGGYGGSEAHKLTISEMPRHHHDYNEGQTRRYQAGADLLARHGARSKSTTPQGSSAPHNNMPPFILMNYIIKT